MQRGASTGPGAGADENVYVFGPFTLIPARRLLLLRDGQPVSLRRQARELLYAFVRRPRFTILDRGELEREVFGNAPVDVTRVSQLVRAVREAAGREYIETVPGEGYMFSVEVSVIPPAPDATPLAPDAEDLQAGNLCRKGYHYLEKCSGAGFGIAIESFEKLIVADPRHVRAHLGLAAAYTWLTIFNYNELPAAEALSKAKESAGVALELAPSSAAAHAACGFSSMSYDRDWRRARKELEEAVRLDPRLAEAHLGLALWHVARGDGAAATREINRAHEIDELSRLMNVTKGFVYFFAGRLEESLRQFKETIEKTTEYRGAAAFDAAYYGRALVVAISGDFPEALAAAKKAYEFSHNVLDEVAEAFILALEKKEAEARAVLKRLADNWEETYVSPYHLATIAAALGDNDEAFKWLYKGRDGLDPWMIAVRMDPRFDGLHSDPRFDELLESLGLPPLNRRDD